MGEVARMLGIEHETARRWAVEGRIPAFRYNNRGRWRANRSDIDNFIRAHLPSAQTGQVEGASQ